MMKKINLKTQAYITIKQKIATCEYAPGTFLSEELLVEELKISRTPIRDALGRLEQEGLLEIRPKKGIIVTPLSIKDVTMIFEIRKLYEPYIIKNYGSALDEEALHKFYKDFSLTNKSSEWFKDNQVFYSLDTAFHQMIVNACQNIYLCQNYELIQTHNERFRFMTGNLSPQRLKDTLQEHLAVIDACLEKKWEEASQSLTFHLEQSRQAAFRLIFDSPDNHHITL